MKKFLLYDSRFYSNPEKATILEVCDTYQEVKKKKREYGGSIIVPISFPDIELIDEKFWINSLLNNLKIGCLCQNCNRKNEEPPFYSCAVGLKLHRICKESNMAVTIIKCGTTDTQGKLMFVPIRPLPRCLILVDVGNLYHEDKNMNYTKLYHELSKDRHIYKAIAYVVEVKKEGEDRFFQNLERIGFEIRKKYAVNKFKADWDTGIVVDCLRLADKVDEVTLVSGDKDYIPLVKELQRRDRSKRVRVRGVGFNNCSAYRLRTQVDEWISLDKLL